MADTEREQAAEPAQEQDPQQAPVPEQELSPEQKKQPDQKEKKDDGLLLPILYALLAAIGVFTLIMFIGIGITIFNNRGSSPSEQTSYQDTVPPDQAADEE